MEDDWAATLAEAKREAQVRHTTRWWQLYWEGRGGGCGAGQLSGRHAVGWVEQRRVGGAPVGLRKHGTAQGLRR